MKNKKKFFYCPKCRKFPETVKEIYDEPLIETRVWDGDCYAIEDSNIDLQSAKTVCVDCETELEDTSD